MSDRHEGGGNGAGRRRIVVGWALATAMALGLLVAAGEAGAQTTLADYDYENLSFRGFSLEGGFIFPSRVDPTYTVGARFDLGYLGPGLRIVPGIAYWSSTMKRSEVAKLERKIDELVAGQIDPAPGFTGVNLGTIDWSDLVLSLDGHFVWAVPFDLLTFAGAGVSAHILNAKGRAISGTFVEDFMDTVSPGLNLHAGLEFPLTDQFRLYGLGRMELMENLRYMELRVGGQIMLAPPAPGEGRSR
jgi:hypothetical protein